MLVHLFKMGNFTLENHILRDCGIQVKPETREICTGETVPSRHQGIEVKPDVKIASVQMAPDLRETGMHAEPSVQTVSVATVPTGVEAFAQTDPVSDDQHEKAALSFAFCRISIRLDTGAIFLSLRVLYPLAVERCLREIGAHCEESRQTLHTDPKHGQGNTDRPPSASTPDAAKKKALQRCTRVSLWGGGFIP